MASAAQAHLHSLSFPLSHLDRLSSLELALIQFHLDNDDKAFGNTVREAQRVWRRRRRAALDAGELLEGERPVAPSRPRLPPPPSLAESMRAPALPPVPVQLRSLTHSIRAAMKAHSFGGSEPGPLASNIGSGLRNRDPQVYKRDPHIKSFKELQAAAVKLGIIVTGKGGTAGRDWLQLTEPYRLTDTPFAAPLRVSSPPPPSPVPDLSIPLPSPLPPSLFHLANLEFDPRLKDLDSLPTHQILLLPFRDDIEATGWTAESDRLWTRIERAFWRRRAAAYERGERWSTQLPVGHPLMRDLDETLPSVIVSQLHVVQVDDLPDARVSNVMALAALLPAHLQFVCATVSAPMFTSHTRTAHLGFRSAKVADAAQNFFAELQIGPGSTGLSARALPSSSTAHWRWMDVRPDERIGLWQYHADLVAFGSQATPVKRSYTGEGIAAGDRLSGVKKPRYSVEPAWPRSASLATEARNGVEQSVRAEDLIPAELLEPTFPAVLLHQKSPRDLQIEHTCDDAWIHRFHADGYMVWQRQVYLCFSSASDRRAFGEWVKSAASRYWKKNGLAIKSLLPSDIVDFGWQFGHFSPAWRRRHGLRLAHVAPRRPTVGEIGFGPDAVPHSVQLGWFPFEYIQAGRDQPPADLVPPQVALAAARRSSHAPSEPLAARLGDGSSRADSLAAASLWSAWDRRTSTPAGALDGGDFVVAAEDTAFPSVKEEEDAEMKPSAEELRRAEELAVAVRINILGSANTSTPRAMEATEPHETTDTTATAPSTPLFSSLASAIPTPVSLEGSPPPIGGATIVHAAEQQAALSRLRRVTAMELMDFEDELEDFTASVAEALGSSSSMSSPTADPAVDFVSAAGSQLPNASAPLQDGVNEVVGSATDPVNSQTQQAVVNSQHASGGTGQTHNASQSTFQRDAAADFSTPPAQHDGLSLPASFATSNESSRSAEPAQHPTTEGPIQSLASSSAPAVAVPAANTVKQQEAVAAARVVPNGLARHGSYGDAVPAPDAPVSARMGPVRSHSNGAGLLGLPVKPSFAMEVPCDNTRW